MALAVLAGSSAVEAAAQSGPEALRVPIGAPAPLPSAFTTHPTRFDWEAAFHTSAAPAQTDDARRFVALDVRLRRQIEDINVTINAQRQDPNRRRLDCVGYVKLKRAALIAAGIPADTLSAAIVMTPGGKSHSVLLFSTDGGDLVLDNLSPYVTSWRDTDYVWVERQLVGTAPDGSERWAWITPQPSARLLQTASR